MLNAFLASVKELQEAIAIKGENERMQLEMQIQRNREQQEQWCAE